MSKTLRRQKGRRNWITPQPDIYWSRGWKWVRFIRYEFNDCFDAETKYIETKLVESYIVVYERKKLLDKKEVNKIESDRGYRSDNRRGTRFFKELNRTSRRNKEKKELHKVKQSCYDGFDEIYEYDDSFENEAERSHIWTCF